jgi:hypothetical protein
MYILKWCISICMVAVEYMSVHLQSLQVFMLLGSESFQSVWSRCFTNVLLCLLYYMKTVPVIEFLNDVDKNNHDNYNTWLSMLQMCTIIPSNKSQEISLCEIQPSIYVICVLIMNQPHTHNLIWFANAAYIYHSKLQVHVDRCYWQRCDFFDSEA